jgi:hypothetical protein
MVLLRILDNCNGVEVCELSHADDEIPLILRRIIRVLASFELSGAW